jgi:5-formyltetrahydrofolate cyclo-ligase
VGESTDNSKSRLRRVIDARRRGVGAEALACASRSVCDRIAEWGPFQAAHHVVLYAAQPWEVDPAGLERACSSDDVAFYYPRVEGTELVFRAGTGSSLRAGRFGIAEPPADAPSLPPDAVAVILVPGIAFDRTGNRLGTGKGYYDRSLTVHRMAVRVGVGLEEFLEDALPRDPWDVPMDAIATERQFLIVGPRAGVHPGDTEWTS